MIEQGLKRYVDDFFNELVLSDDYADGHKYKDILKASIDLFLENRNNYSALNVYEMFFMIYQPNYDKQSSSQIDILNESNIPLDFAKLMNKYGYLASHDVIVHSVEVFILGLAIYSQNKKYRSFFEEYVTARYERYYSIEGEFSHEEFLYRWAIASLFCDITIPFEFMTKSLKNKLNSEFNSILSVYGEKYSADFSSIRKLDSIDLNPSFKDSYSRQHPKAKFLDLSKPTQLLVHKINLDLNMGLKNQNLLLEIIENFMYGDCPDSENERIDHGIISAIILVNFYGYMMQKYDRHPDFFFYPIVDSASAILLHNLYRVLMRKPFEAERMSVHDCPLAYMLKLCNEIRFPAVEADFRIDDNIFQVRYYLRDISDRYNINPMVVENYIPHILNIRQIFGHGLSIEVETSSMHEDSLDLLKSEVPYLNVDIGNIENLALNLHKHYEKLFSDDSKEYPAFHELPSKFKRNTISHARSIYRMLNIIGCEIADIDDERPGYELSKYEIYDLAILTHKLWYEEKEATGWSWGPIKDDEKRISPMMLPWDELSLDVEKLNIREAEGIPNLLNGCGFKIVLNKFALLADSFLSYGDRYFKYIQINRLIGILSEYGYGIVDISKRQSAIEEFDLDEVQSIARRNHEEWYGLELRFGCGDEKVLSNLVNWELLEGNVRRGKVDEIKRLPKMCNDVGLKIVKTK